MQHQIDIIYINGNTVSQVQNVFEDDLQECKDDTHWINDVEFKRKYRCSCPMIDKIVEWIETMKYSRGELGGLCRYQ